MNAQELEQAIHDEWRAMHHNASIDYPDLQNEYEGELFWSCLSEDVSFWIDDLAECIREDFGESLTFYSYGRQGATIAPSEYMRCVGGSGFGPLNGEKLGEYGYDGIEAFNENRRILKMFKFINNYWRSTAKYIPEWWKNTKEANDYQEMIDEHDGKTARIVQVWA